MRLRKHHYALLGIVSTISDPTSKNIVLAANTTRTPIATAFNGLSEMAKAGLLRAEPYPATSSEGKTYTGHRYFLTDAGTTALREYQAQATQPKKSLLERLFGGLFKFSPALTEDDPLKPSAMRPFPLGG